MRRKRSRLAALSLVLTLLSMGNTLADESQLAIRPKLSSTWERQPDREQLAHQPSVPYRWAVYKNRTNEDLLSFATLTSESVGDLDLIYYSDAALEIFPDGNPVWTTHDANTKIESLAVDVVRDHGRRRPGGSMMLKYSFISKPQGQPNRMAQGRAWIDADTIVFVQHTSDRSARRLWLTRFASYANPTVMDCKQVW